MKLFLALQLEGSICNLLQQNWIVNTWVRDPMKNCFSLPLPPPQPINWKVSCISIHKPDSCCLLTFLPGQQKALFMFVRIRGWQGGGILPGNGTAAFFNFITKNKALLLFNRTLKGRPHKHSSHFFETTNMRNSLRPCHEKQKEKSTLFCKN